MPNSLTQLMAPAADLHRLEWHRHPQLGELATPLVLALVHQHYRMLDGAVVTIDLDGPQVGLSLCSIDDFNLSFESNDGVLLGDNPPLLMPVHLLFERPMLAVGAHVSADGRVRRNYVAQLFVRFEDGELQCVRTPGQLSSTRNSAPFLGVRTDGASGITEAWFDALPTSGTSDFIRVAINRLLYLSSP